MKKKLMALMLSGVLVLQSAGMAYGADFSDGTEVEVYGDSENFSDSNGNTAEEQFSGGLEEQQNVQEEAPDEENEQNVESATATPTSGTCGVNLKWKLDNGTLTISGNGDMYNYDYKYNDDNNNRSPWQDSDIKRVVIKQGVTSIGDSVFYGCNNLTSITIPNGVKNIGVAAFGGCRGLTSITIPNGVRSIDKSVFHGCSS